MVSPQRFYGEDYPQPNIGAVAVVGLLQVGDHLSRLGDRCGSVAIGPKLGRLEYFKVGNGHPIKLACRGKFDHGAQIGPAHR